MANKITGRVILITPTQTLKSNSGKEYQKREFVIERTVFDRNTGQPTTDPNDTPLFRVMGGMAQELDKISVGDYVTVSYDIEGRSYIKEGVKKYFTDLRVYRVDTQKATPVTEIQSEQEQLYNPTQETASDPFISNDTVNTEGTKDDLPF